MLAREIATASAMLIIQDDSESGSHDDLTPHKPDRPPSNFRPEAASDSEDALDFGVGAANGSSSKSPPRTTNTASTTITEEVQEALCFEAVGDSKPPPSESARSKIGKFAKRRVCSHKRKVGQREPGSRKRKSGQREADPRSASDIDAEVQKLFKTTGRAKRAQG